MKRLFLILSALCILIGASDRFCSAGTERVIADYTSYPAFTATPPTPNI